MCNQHSKYSGHIQLADSKPTEFCRYMADIMINGYVLYKLVCKRFLKRKIPRNFRSYLDREIRKFFSLYCIHYFIIIIFIILIFTTYVGISWRRKYSQESLFYAVNLKDHDLEITYSVITKVSVPLTFADALKLNSSPYLEPSLTRIIFRSLRSREANVFIIYFYRLLLVIMLNISNCLLYTSPSPRDS